jgi:hypothetical protein
MSTQTNTPADHATELAQYLAGYTRGNPSAAAQLLGTPQSDLAASAKTLLLQRRLTLLSALPDHLLAAIASGELTISQPTKTAKGKEAAMCESIEAQLTEFAERQLNIPTLKSRNSDSLDFHNVSVWAVKEALENAYKAGRLAA